jgi:hypothetical protein
LYFKLVNIFATPYAAGPNALGVPLVLHYNVTATPGRATVGAVYTQIVSDLKTAINTAPDYTSSVFISKYAMEGLLARTYMYMGNYANALTTATDVISKGPFTLVTAPNLKGFWSNPNVQTSAIEVMFEVDCDPVNNNGFDDLGGIFINGYQDIYASSDLVNLYSPTDARAGLLLSGSTKTGAQAYLINKYPNAQSTDRDNPKVIRLAEVYLIAAESAARTGKPSVALGFLNTLMDNRDPGFVYNDAGSVLIDDIITERRKELAFEGDRLYDMQRLGLDINRASNAGSAPLGDGLSIPYPNDFRIAPIPQQETLRNPTIALQQNPGY